MATVAAFPRLAVRCAAGGHVDRLGGATSPAHGVDMDVPEKVVSFSAVSIMKQEPTDATLVDYLRSLRRGWAIIVLAALVCGTAALGASLLQKRSYEAQASLTVQDANAALALTGAGAAPTETPLQLAAAHVSQVVRQAVVQKVKTDLRSPLTTDALKRAVSVSVDPNSALVDITTHSRSATEAAAIANGFANADASLTTAEARHRYALEASQLSKRLLSGAGANNPVTRAIYLNQLTRLQTLSSVAAPVQVNTSAQVPSTPSSPRPVRNMLAALVFGLLLGVLLAYGRDALDRRLRQPSQVEEVLDHPVIGAVRAGVLGKVGAHSDVSSNGVGPLDPVDEDAFRVIRQNVRYLTADPLRSVLITSGVAEEGKSTVAACLAAATAAAGKRTLLVECDLRRPVLARRLGLPPDPGLTDYLTDNAKPLEILRLVPTLQPTSNGESALSNVGEHKLVCITAGTAAPRPTELLASERFRSFLREVSEVYEAVILDSAPLLTVADTLELVPDVAGVLLCIRLRKTTREQARAIQAALDRLPARPIGIVVTDMPESDKGYYGYYGYSAGPAAAQH